MIIKNNIKYLLIPFILSCISACSSIDKTNFDYGDAPPDLADTDGDGVVNERDICPETPKNTVITFDGCTYWRDIDSVKEAVVFFDIGSSVVRFEHVDDISNIVEYVKKVPEAKIFIEGYTSKIGSKIINSKLQRARSESVKKLLIEEGADPGMIVIHEQGEKTQHVEENTESSISVNQRAYIHAVKPEKTLQIKWNIYGGKGNATSKLELDKGSWNIMLTK